MKTIFRFSGLAVLAGAFVLSGATASFAQEACADTDGQTALYTKFTGTYNKKTSAELKPALATGKEFLEKYGACGEGLKDQINFVQAQVERIDKLIPKLEKDEKLGPLFKRYDTAITSDNVDEIFAAGKEILAVTPENVNIAIPMALAGFDQAYLKKNNKYADESLKYAQIALTNLKGGKPCERKDKSGAETCGALKYELPRQDVINELTFATAFLNYYAKNNKKGALPIYYELAQSNSKYKTNPGVFRAIGDYYIDESTPIGEEIVKLIEAGKASTTPEETTKIAEQIKTKEALYKGYMERAIDAYGRANSVAKSDTPAAKAYKDGISKTLQQLYERRFPDKKVSLNEFVQAALAKPMPDPTSAVQPVTDPEPTNTTSTGTATPASAAPAAANTNGNGKTAATTKPKQ